jgi:hypothetical protein
VKIYLQRNKQRDCYRELEQGMNSQTSMIACVLASSWRRRPISRLDGKTGGFFGFRVLENPPDS